MAIQHPPTLGEALWCDFAGIPPEMVKRRLAVVVSPKSMQRPRLATVVPLSTTPPERAPPWCCELAHDPMPGGGERPVWAKCDMLAVVSFARLSNVYVRWGGRREYRKLRVGIGDLRRIQRGVLCGLGFAELARYLPMDLHDSHLLHDIRDRAE